MDPRSQPPEPSLTPDANLLPTAPQDETAEHAPAGLPFAPTATTPEQGAAGVLPAPPGGNVGAYQLLAELERGGMGIVYKARHVTLGRVVALKMMRADALARPQDAQRFEREMRAVARLNHPHIVPIYEVGRYEDRPYYTMAYAPGGSLTGHRQRLPADPRAVLVLIEKVARAVHYAHEQGIVHRDLKPGNVLLDERGEPLVSDFGLAKLHDGDVELTQTGAVLGTPAYMAPEQAAGRTRDIGPPTDVWALGVMLYEFLAGRRPFLGDSAEEMKERIRTVPPPRLRSVAAGVDPGVEAVVHQCLEKEPARRYPTAAALADDLARCLRGERPVARREPWPRRLWRGLRRHPLRSAGLILCAAAVMVLGVALSFLVHQMTAPTPPAEEPPLVLVGTSGAPGQWRVPLGKEADVVAAAPNEPFSVRSDNVTLVELQPAPPWESYRLEAEVRQIKSKDGDLGIFFGHCPVASGQMRYHVFWSVGFADLGRFAGRLELAGCHIQDVPEWIFNTAPPTRPPHDFDPVSGDDGAGPWRKIAVEVDAEEVRVYWQDEGCVIRAPLARLEKDSTFVKFPDPSTLGESPARRGGLGVYVQQGLASFRQVLIKPLR
jgi:tRNA A-37 threonylcarbamoyl transferase component Bud32